MRTQTVSDHCTRYAMNVRFTYHRVAERGYPRRAGWTRDLNFRGAWVELPEPVGRGSFLQVTLAMPAGDLAVVAHVAWARPDLLNAPYLHGLRFTGVTPGTREQLRSLFANEKARPVRLYCALAATCNRKGVKCPTVPGAIRDLSDDGACVRLPEPLAPGTELGICATTGVGKIAADARVVWADQSRAELPRDASYRHGLRFLRVHPLSELPLRALLDGIHGEIPRTVVT
jgi:hypothetical protein